MNNSCDACLDFFPLLKLYVWLLFWSIRQCLHRHPFGTSFFFPTQRFSWEGNTWALRSWWLHQPRKRNCHKILTSQTTSLSSKQRSNDTDTSQVTRGKYYTNQVSQESIWGGSQGKWHETRNRKSLGWLFNQRQEENRGNSSKNSVYGETSNLQREFQWWLQFLEEEAINQMPESVSLTREDRQ